MEFVVENKPGFKSSDKKKMSGNVFTVKLRKMIIKKTKQWNEANRQGFEYL